MRILDLLKTARKLLSGVLSAVRFSSTRYWEQRARQHGIRSVLNLSHSEEEVQKITEFQVNTLFPLLKKELTGNEKAVLDFGCGPGRFTGFLAETINGYALGVDPISHLLSLAPKHANVEYKSLSGQKIPAPNNSFDVIWICLVLGGIIKEKQLEHTITELKRVAKRNALLFLVENTSEKKDILTWKYRSTQRYITLFSDFNIRLLDDYEDLGETISIFAGKRNQNE